MAFEFATATRIVFGRGTAEEVPGIARHLGRRALLVAGQPRGAAAVLADGLEASGLVASRLTIRSEPTIDDVRDGVRAASSASCDLVVALGGGSVIDTGKAVAALLANPGDPLDYLEVVGAGRPLTHPSAPMVAIPTTAGSGAEVTKNAVLASRSHRVKASLRSPLMLPRVAVVDPVLTVDLPPALTAATGLDALAQLIEPYLSRRANPLTDVLCRDGMARVSLSLRTAFHDGARIEARESLSLASLFGGLALANAGLGAVHGFAGPLGGRFDAPHGALCAALLPGVMRVNLAAVRARDGNGPAAARFEQVARWLTREPGASAEDGIAWLEAIRTEMRIPALSAYGLTEADVGGVVEQARASSSLRGNPIELTGEELAQILLGAM